MLVFASASFERAEREIFPINFNGKSRVIIFVHFKRVLPFNEGRFSEIQSEDEGYFVSLTFVQSEGC